MRILYVDFNASYLNPTRNLVPLALMRAGETMLFGPGHVDSATLRRGLHAFVAIADAGQRLVFAKHSLVARAEQIRETLAAMADGSFAGGRWNNGEYTVARQRSS